MDLTAATPERMEKFHRQRSVTMIIRGWNQLDDLEVKVGQRLKDVECIGLRQLCAALGITGVQLVDLFALAGSWDSDGRPNHGWMRGDRNVMGLLSTLIGKPIEVFAHDPHQSYAAFFTVHPLDGVAFRDAMRAWCQFVNRQMYPSIWRRQWLRLTACLPRWSAPPVRLLLCQKWEKYESGQAARPDGYSLHASELDRRSFCRRRMRRLNRRSTTYRWHAAGTPYWCSVAEVTYCRVLRSPTGVYLAEGSASGRLADEAAVIVAG